MDFNQNRTCSGSIDIRVVLDRHVMFMQRALDLSLTTSTITREWDFSAKTSSTAAIDSSSKSTRNPSPMCTFRARALLQCLHAAHRHHHLTQHALRLHQVIAAYARMKYVVCLYSKTKKRHRALYAIEARRVIAPQPALVVTVFSRIFSLHLQL